MSDRSQRAHSLSLACAALVLPALLASQLPLSLDGMDSVGFALALREYDPGLEQPHPPGYPVYILVCRALAALGLGEVAALALPGIAAAPVLVWAAARTARHAGLAPRAQVVAALWTAVHPLLLAEGARPAPDLLGAASAWGALGLALERRFSVSGSVLGLALGVRPDLAPFALLGAALQRGERARFAAGLVAGTLAWLAPMIASAPPDWLARGAAFARGHFSVWGSSALAGAGDPAAALRGLALLASGPVGAALACLGARHAGIPRALALAAGGYALWVALGQNLAHARHWLPLAPSLAVLGSAGIASLPRRRTRVAAGALGLALALPFLIHARRARLDGAELVARAVEACGACDAVYAGASARLFERYAPPGFPAYRRSSLAAIRLDLEAWGLERARLVATDEIEGAALRGVPVARVGPIGLYRIDAAALR
jgi:hypothetical protein